MKKLIILFLALLMATPALARRTDMMSSYGYKSKNTQKKYTARGRTNNSGSFGHRCCDGDVYMARPDRYMGHFYRSRAAQMLYENEQYNNYVDRNRYLKELRQLELEKRRRELNR